MPAVGSRPLRHISPVTEAERPRPPARNLGVPRWKIKLEPITGRADDVSVVARGSKKLGAFDT